MWPTTSAPSLQPLSSGSDAAAGPCLNCGTPLKGEFCSACGQRDLPPEPPLGELLGEAWGEFINVDGKVMSTLRLLLLKPGELTRQYLSGHRARYMPPLRLYLTCTLAFFLIEASKPARPAPAIQIGKPRPAGTARSLTPAFDKMDTLHASAFARRLWRNSRRVAADGHNFTSDFGVQMPRALFVIMPLFALMLGVAYRSRQRRYSAHLIMSLHLHAMGFALFAVIALFNLVPWRPMRTPMKLAAIAWMFAYVPLAFRRLYGGRWLPTLARTSMLAVSYGLLLFVAVAVIGIGLVFMY